MPKIYARACVMMCKKPDFWLYLSKRTIRLVTNEEEALKAVRLLTGIRSRAEFNNDPAAAIRWARLITDFNRNKHHDDHTTN